MEKTLQEKQLAIKEILDDIEALKSIDVQGNYRQTVSRIRRIRQRRSAFCGIAATFVLLISSWFFFRGNNVTDNLISVTAPVGEVLCLTLPDSSHVWLNSGSTLSYPEVFRKDHRDVHLSGQAFFDVTASQKQPFFVRTDAGITINVYGTRFDVIAYPDESFTQALLVEGSVNVLFNSDKVECTLSPLQKLTYSRKDGEFNVENFAAEDMVGWIDGQLVFNNCPMDEILNAVSRHFGSRMKMTDFSHSDVSYHAMFVNGESLEDILNYLSLVSPLKWKAKSCRDGEKEYTVIY